ncbi:SAM-dependent methyltransferase [Clostridiaceae bacterium M8S5]|nr:SAM-dependent methyltransferase [Clostridiaceae bacterium M8S5]
MRKVNKLLFTSDTLSSEMALNEIIKKFKDITFERWIDKGIGLVNLHTSFIKIAKAFKEDNMIFTRHICPVNMEIDIRKSIEDINIIIEQIDEIKDLLDSGKTFSVQARLCSDIKFDYKRSDISRGLAQKLENLGFKQDVKNPEQIISITNTDEEALLGVSNASYNLSDWCAGECKYRKDKNLISRAEFKLLEAIDVFDLDLDKYKTALDLGAAPGGWTRVLLKHDLKVVAVDPAKLNKSIAKNPNVIHFKGLAQKYLRKNNKFDVIVNDMKMNVKDSISLMGMASKYLNDGGIAIMTLKLPNKRWQTITNNALNQLSDWYDILGVRQLFHNRSEVTVVLKKSNDNT